MRERLQGPELTDEDRAHFHFAIAKALEDSKCFPESFDHYVKANALRCARVGWEPAQNTALVQRSKATFTQEFFAARRGFGAPAADPIFIVGLPRAGSTLLEQILASHSAVEGTMELPTLPQIAREFAKKDHTTVMYARDKVKELMATNDAYKNKVLMLRELCQGD